MQLTGFKEDQGMEYFKNANAIGVSDCQCPFSTMKGVKLLSSPN